MESLVEKCRAEYDRLIQAKLAERSPKSFAQLYSLHKKSKADALDFLRRRLPKLGENINQTTCIKMLTNDIEDAFEDIQDIYGFSPDKQAEDEEESDEDIPEDIAIGIDLGTTNCCVALYHKRRVIVIPNQKFDGSMTTPSYVTIASDGTTIIGQYAKANAFKNPESTVYDAKRMIGRKINDPVLQNDIKYWPFTVKEDEGVPKILIHGKLYHPEEISAKLLMEMQSLAEDHFQLESGTIKKAVITVPAYFTDGQRQATVDAGTIAGLQVLTILNEPTAAAIAYSFQRITKKPKNVLIFDLGGGTFDVAVLEMKEGEINVMGVDGDSHLGGEDFDKNMMVHCAKVFHQKENIDLIKQKDSIVRREREESRRNIGRLQMHCEYNKKFFAGAREAQISIDGLVNGKDLCVTIKREEFEAMNDDLFRRTIRIVERAILSCGLQKEHIDDVVLVGGSSRIVKIQELLKQYFNTKKLNISINPDEAVAYGAAVQAAIMTGKARGQFKFKQIQDVTPMSIGIEVYSKEHSVIIPKNTKIPAKHTKEYVTAVDNQTEVLVKIFEGEENIASSNKLLGEFVLEGIPSAAAGKETVFVTMLINSMGILHVEAESKGNWRKAKITVNENKDRMSNAKIEKLQMEARLPPPSS